MSWPSCLRLALQLGAGSLGVHELRYRLGHAHDGRSLGDHGHDYLSVVTPLLALLIALAAAHFAWAVWTRRSGAVARRNRMNAGAFALALLALHLGQEALEGVLAFGHAHQLAAVAGEGGWFAVALSCAVAALLSGLTAGARRLARAVLERSAGLTRGAGRGSFRAPPSVLARPCPPLARHGAERAPPLLAS